MDDSPTLEMEDVENAVEEAYADPDADLFALEAERAQSTIAADIPVAQDEGPLRNLTLYNPPTGGPFKDRPDLAAKLIDTLCYTMGEERLQYALDMRKAGWQGDLWMYMLQHGVRDIERNAEQKTGTAAFPDKGTPYRNNFAWKGGKDIVRLRDAARGHPFLLSPEGAIIRKNSDRAFVVVDFRHKEWRKFVQERMQELSSTVGSHYAGLWLDDLGTDGLRLFEVGMTKTKQYGDPEGPAYYDALIDYLQFMRSQSAAVGWRFGGNLQGVYGGKKGDRWARAADELIKDEGYGPGVVMIEYAWISWDGDWPSEWEWEQTFQKTQYVLANGGEIWHVIPVNGEAAAKGGDDNADYQKAKFGYTSSLLFAEGRTAVRIGRDYAYQGNFDFFGAGDKLGKPDEHLKIEGSVYRRSFEHGEVWVDVKNHTSGIEYLPVVEIPETPENPEPPIEEPPQQPEEPQPPVEEVPTPEPEQPTPEPLDIRPTFYIRGTVMDVEFSAVIGIDQSVLLPILRAISATLKESNAEVIPQS
jgi:hypothetical protein